MSDDPRDTVTGPVDFAHPAAVRWTYDTPGEPVPHEQRRKIAIVGFASSSRHLAPWDDPEWEIWTLNQLYRHAPRADRHFDIHVNWNESVVPGTDHEAWIRQARMPVYMNDRHIDVPHVVRFPIETTTALMGRRYFSSSIAHEVAFAISLLIDPETVTPDRRHGAAYPGAALALYGVDLAVGEEYVDQKPCTEYWLGVAEALGINVVIPEESSLLTATHCYGYETEPELGGVKLTELSAFRGMLATSRDKAKFTAYAHEGAIQAVDEITNLTLLRARGVKTGTLVVHARD